MKLNKYLISIWFKKKTEVINTFQVSIKFNKKKALPGEKVELQIKADAKSLVNILSVDKSVLLYKTGNDITVQDVSIQPITKR